MSNMASEEMKGTEEVPETSVSAPGPESSRIKEILSRVSASNADKYYKLLQDSGFDSLESLTLGFADFRSVFPEILPGHASAILAQVRARVREPRQLFEAGVSPAPNATSVRDNSIEKRSLAGSIPTFPSNAEDDEAKVQSWFVGVTAWARVWSQSMADACIDIEKYPDKPLTGTGIVISEEEDAYGGNCFMVAHQSDAAVMALFGQSIKDSPTLTEILSVLANMYRSKNADYVDKIRRGFINVTPCTQEWRL